MRIAIIDLGTNSVRFDVQQLSSAKKIRQLHREKIMVRLGQGVFLKGKLDRSAVRRTIHAFLRFRKVAHQLKAAKIVAFGTSALREVSDREKFLHEVEAKTGIQVRVISGQEEAQLIALGVLSHEKIRKETVALVDIGGGSTEISICRGQKVLHSASFPLGTARLQQLFLRTSPPNGDGVEEARKYIRGTLSQILVSERWPKVGRAIGSSGTIKALARLTSGSYTGIIERKKLQSLVGRMEAMSTTELLGISGMESKRVDMILAGAVLFEECMDLLGAKKAATTEYSLRDGILEEELRIFRQGGGSHLTLHVSDLVEKAKKFGGDEKHILRTVQMAETLFDALAPLHKLKPEWKIYLAAATILRDTGEAISLSNHEEHSCYIVKKANFPGAEDWEAELIGDLCLYHEGGAKVPHENREAFLKLLAILRVVDALDSGPESVIRIKKVQLQRDEVRIYYTGRGLTGLEGLNVEKRAGFFKKNLRRPIVAISSKN